MARFVYKERQITSEMKKLSFLSLALVALLASCKDVKQSEEYLSLQAERDSLQVVAAAANGDFEASLRTINEIETALEAVRTAENIILLENQEGNTNRAVEEINAIQQTLQQNRQKIADLEKQLAAQGSKSKALNQTIDRLKEQLDAKDVAITSLREQLQSKDVEIGHLNEQVADLNENLETLNIQNAEQQAVIHNQDQAMNTVFYCVGTMEALIEKGLMTKGGLFKPKEVVDGVFDNAQFVQADKRKLTSIQLNTKKATIQTSHPEGSFSLVEDENGSLVLNITDANAFWNKTNYLIVSIK